MARFGTLDTQYLDNAGDPLISGKIAFKDSILNTDKDTFADINETILNANPLILNADGTQPNCFFSGTAKGILYTSADVQVRVMDPLYATGGASASAVFPSWVSTETYSFGNIVKGSDSLNYKCIEVSSQGSDPLTTAADWSQIKITGVWNTNESYAIGHIVQGSNGSLYIAIVAQSGNDPINDIVNWKSAGSDGFLKDYGEIVNIIGGTGGGTQDIDLEAGNVVSLTVDTSTNTFTFSNPTPTAIASGITLWVTNGGSQTVNWPASVDWPAGLAPTLTSSGVDKLVFETIDGGTIWQGNLVALAYA